MSLTSENNGDTIYVETQDSPSVFTAQIALQRSKSQTDYWQDISSGLEAAGITLTLDTADSSDDVFYYSLRDPGVGDTLYLVLQDLLPGDLVAASVVGTYEVWILFEPQAECVSCSDEEDISSSSETVPSSSSSLNEANDDESF